MWTILIISGLMLVSSLAGTFVNQSWMMRTTGDFGKDAARIESVINARHCLVWWAEEKLGTYTVDAGDAAARRGDFREACERYNYLIDRQAREGADTGFEDCAGQRLTELPQKLYDYAMRLLHEHRCVRARKVLEDFHDLFPDADATLKERVKQAYNDSWLQEIRHLQSLHYYKTALTKIRDLGTAGAPHDVVASARQMIAPIAKMRVNRFLAKHDVGTAYGAVDETLDMFLGDTGIERQIKGLYRWITSRAFHVDAGKPLTDTVLPPDWVGEARLPRQAALSIKNVGTRAVVVSLVSADRFDDPHKMEIKPKGTQTLVLPVGSYWELCVYRIDGLSEGQMGRFEMRAGSYSQEFGM